jgi:hypothetical protein
VENIFPLNLAKLDNFVSTSKEDFSFLFKVVAMGEKGKNLA